MSYAKNLILNDDDEIYQYDGSFEGLLCCVFECIYGKVIPSDIQNVNEAPLTLFKTKFIETHTDKAERVYNSIILKISSNALVLVKTVFLSCLEKKELCILRFLLRGYKEGGKILYMLGDKDVSPLLAAQRHLMHEAHRLKGFIRFTDTSEALVATITPKNYILPFIANHFIARYNNENFLIYDKSHKSALIWQDKNKQIVAIEDIKFPDITEKEEQYRALWKRFYNTVAIEARDNPKCRMTHMPKRYWENMLEVQDLL